MLATGACFPAREVRCPAAGGPGAARRPRGGRDGRDGCGGVRDRRRRRRRLETRTFVVVRAARRGGDSLDARRGDEGGDGDARDTPGRRTEEGGGHRGATSGSVHTSSGGGDGDVNNPATEHRAEVASALESWLKTFEGFETCGIAVRWLGDERGYGGVVTSEVITAGAPLVRVPRAAMLTAEEARSCPRVGAAARAITEWQAVTLKLLHERDAHRRLRSQAAAAAAAAADDDDDNDAGGSEWGAWLDMLPEAEDMRETHPLLWSAQRRGAYLEGSPTLDVLEKLLDECAEDRRAIARAMTGSRDVDDDELTWPSLDDDELTWPSLDDVLWAEAIITSRAFYLSRLNHQEGDEDHGDDGVVEDGEVEVEGRMGKHSEGEEVGDDAKAYAFIKALNEETSDDDDDDDTFEAFGGVSRDVAGGDPWETPDTFLALVPWADALNHDVDAGPEALLTYDPVTRVAHITATSTTPRGGEVFDSYGPGKTRADLLMNYGFVAVAAAGGEGRQSEEEENEGAEGAEGENGTARDVVDLPGDAFWAEAEDVLLSAAATDDEVFVDSAGEYDEGPLSHREALRSLLGAVGMTPGDTAVRVTADGVGENAMEWCQLAVTTRAELEEAEAAAAGFGFRSDADVECARVSSQMFDDHRCRYLEADPDDAAWADEEEEGTEEEAWAVIVALMDGVGSEAARRRADRARRVLRRLCARRLEGYPEWAHGLAERGEGEGPASGAAAGMVLASEIRALKGALQSLAA